MSFNRLQYDTCAYEQVLSETVGPGFYQLATPPNVCEPCHPTDPYIRLQGQGASLSRNHNLIDIESDLMGGSLFRANSQCPEKKYMPGINASPMCGVAENTCTRANCDSKTCITHAKNPIKVKDCFSETTNQRLMNPPCNLRGAGAANRWEWLPMGDPQNHVAMPFDTSIDTKTMSKDNHRPYIRDPMSSQIGQPEPTSDEVQCDRIYDFCAVPVGPPSINWRSLDEISKY